MNRQRMNLRYTLVGEGTSDRALMPVLEWLIHDLAGSLPVEGQWADIGRAPMKLVSLREKVLFALDYFPCDILFVHRDSDAQPPEFRHQEVQNVAQEVSHVLHSLEAVAVPVVPVKMMEAWLLIDEKAIRFAGGNPAGSESLDLPKAKAIEKIADPKTLLREAIVKASGLKGRHLSKLNLSHSVQRVASSIGDFSPLLRLGAVQKLRANLSKALNGLGLLE